MTPAALRAAASATSPLDGQPISHLYLTLHRATPPPRGRDVRLAGRAGPLGRLCNVKEAPGGGYACVATFRAADVLAFCDRSAA
jgi:hypothetical protein